MKGPHVFVGRSDLVGYSKHGSLIRLGVKATTCKAKAKAKDLIPEDKVGYQNHCVKI